MFRNYVIKRKSYYYLDITNCMSQFYVASVYVHNNIMMRKSITRVLKKKVTSFNVRMNIFWKKEFIDIVGNSSTRYGTVPVKWFQIQEH